MLRLSLASASTVAFGAVFAPGAAAQNTGTVFSPGVDAGERAVEVRYSLIPEEDGRDTRYAIRAHYQQALNDSVRLRLFVQYRDNGTGSLEHQRTRGELQWQIVETTPSGYSSAFRFDVQRNEGSGATWDLAAYWTNQWSLADGWQSRAIVGIGRELGDAASDGLFLETRAHLTRKLDNGLRVGVEGFSDWGNTDTGFGDFDEESHQYGPIVSGSFGDGWGWAGLTLFGVSDAAPDVNFQLRLAREF